MSGWRVEPLKDHDRKGFNSGSNALDTYLIERVTQDIRRRIAFCFVLVSEEGVVAGYYTLSATSIAFDQLPPERAKKLPRYPVVPAALLGRLAVSQAHQGQRLGSALVADAILRSGRSELMSYALVVDAIDEPAVSFYEHLGFMRLQSMPMRLLRPL